jgi:hypothetical protein
MWVGRYTDVTIWLQLNPLVVFGVFLYLSFFQLATLFQSDSQSQVPTESRGRERSSHRCSLDASPCGKSLALSG